MVEEREDKTEEEGESDGDDKEDKEAEKKEADEFRKQQLIRGCKDQYCEY